MPTINCADADVLAALREIVGETAYRATTGQIADQADISVSAATASLHRLKAAGRVKRERLHRATYWGLATNGTGDTDGDR